VLIVGIVAAITTTTATIIQ